MDLFRRDGLMMRASPENQKNGKKYESIGSQRDDGHASSEKRPQSGLFLSRLSIFGPIKRVWAVTFYRLAGL
jgi:hypothetical protein